MAKLSGVQQSLKKQNNGVWVKWCGMNFLIARFGNPLATKLTNEEAARNRERKQRKEPERAFDEFWNELLAKAILLDWDNVEGEDDKPIKYTEEEGIKLFNDPRFSDLKAMINREAATRENFLEQADREAEKN